MAQSEQVDEDRDDTRLYRGLRQVPEIRVNCIVGIACLGAEKELEAGEGWVEWGAVRNGVPPRFVAGGPEFAQRADEVRRDVCVICRGDGGWAELEKWVQEQEYPGEIFLVSL
jgi:hypothetical protein